MNMLVRGRVSLLDVAAEVLVADPSAPLSQVAEAAGIGRTTLHKHYATRDDLIRAVGHRALDLWEAAVGKVPDGDQADGGLGDIVAAMIPIGPQLAFLWRIPAFDHDPEVKARSHAAEERCLEVLRRARDAGVLAPGTPEWWLLHTLYALVYSAAESVGSGHLAPRDAPRLVLHTLLRGVGRDEETSL